MKNFMIKHKTKIQDQNDNNILAMLLEALLLSDQDPKELLKSLNLA
jgi:hypothetical protein